MLDNPCGLINVREQETKSKRMDKIIEIVAVDTSLRVNGEGIDISCDLLRVTSSAHNNMFDDLRQAIFNKNEARNFLIKCQGREIPFYGYVDYLSFDSVSLTNNR